MRLLFPTTELSETEMTIASEALMNPAVQKYLRRLGQGIQLDILEGRPSEGQSSEEFLRNIARAQGQLLTLDILLSIGETVKAELNPSQQ